MSSEETTTRGYPCYACRKFSDAAKKVKGTDVMLCGTDFDAWLKSAEKKHADRGERTVEAMISEFLRRRTAEILNVAR